MTTPKTYAEKTKTAQSPGRFRLPDPPERELDEVTQFDHLFKSGNSHHLAVHLGNPETTLVEADRWVCPDTNFNKARARVPDLLVAFDVDPQIYEENNGYIVSEQGKPPDFVLEVASVSTAHVDTGDKRIYYADLGIPEYWRFDKTGEYHGARLAGDSLVDGEYVALPIEELPDGSLQGYSAALRLNIRWEEGEIVFYDPDTGGRIATFEDEREARVAAEAHAARAEAHANRAEAHANRAEAHAARIEARADRAEARADRAESRVRELEELLRRRNS